MLANDLSLALDPALLMQKQGLSPDPWQMQFLRSQAERQILLCTRQAGKSTTTAVLALHEAVFTSNALVLLLSPSLRQSQELFRKVLATYKSTASMPSSMESALRIEFENGSRIVSLPGKEETVRGYSGVSLLIVDEASRVAGDHRGSTVIGNEVAKGVAVVGLVGEDVIRPETVEQGRRLRHIPPLPRREDHPHGPSPGIGRKVDLGGQTSSRTPQSLVSAPPFPVAACW